MPRQKHLRKTDSSSRESKASQPQEAADAAKKNRDDELKAELDALLDEIDDVLEENAETFVAGYIQKGGQAVRVVWRWFLEPVGALRWL